MTLVTRILLALSFLLPALEAAALEVVPVPADPADPAIPLPAYHGKPTLLAAVVRDAPSTIYYRCDANADGVWDLDALNPTGADGNGWYQASGGDLDFHVNYPAVSVNTVYQARWQVAENTGGAGSFFVTSPVVVLADMPDPNVVTSWADGADDAQLTVQRRQVLHDALWYLHQRMARSGSGTNQITGYLNAYNEPARLSVTALYLAALLEAGYLPAYPPGTFEDLGLTPPTGWLDANDQRWNTSPYAEDALRLMNFLLVNLNVTGIPTDDEDDDGNSGIPGTNDGAGYLIYSTLSELHPAQPLALAALADCPMAGTAAQTGSLARGKPWELIIQQMVDYLVAIQYDLNSGVQGVGAYGYTACMNCGNNAAQAYALHTGWAVYGLYRAEQALGDAGVYVNQRFKERLPNMLYYNLHADGCPRYTTAGTASSYSLFEPMGHFLLAYRWLGWDQWELSDPSVVSYPYLSLPRAQARQIYETMLTMATWRWTSSGSGSLVDGNAALWADGNYGSGTRGHSFFQSMLALTTGLSGAVDLLDGRDWRREFAVDCVFQQKLSSTWYDSYTSSHYSASYLGTDGVTAQAALLMGRLGGLQDSQPPAAPAQFSVDYGAGGNTLAWTPVDELDVTAYRVYRADSQPVPVDEAHLVAETAGHTYLDSNYQWGVFYRLVAVDYSGNTSEALAPTGVSAAPQEPVAAAATVLLPAHPNPFNPATRLAFSLAHEEEVWLRVYDLAGHQVATLVGGSRLPAGTHHRDWNGRLADGKVAPAGVYLYRLEAGEHQATGRMTLLK